jgi:hypothetical protein
MINSRPQRRIRAIAETTSRRGSMAPCKAGLQEHLNFKPAKSCMRVRLCLDNTFTENSVQDVKPLILLPGNDFWRLAGNPQRRSQPPYEEGGMNARYA